MALIFDNVNNQIIDSNGNVIAPLDLNLVVQNDGGAPSLKEDLFANLPTAGTPGRLFVATDTNQLLRDNGATWDVIGAAGSGTVTSVGLAAPPQFAVSGSPITTFGNLALAWNTQPINKIFAGPSSGTDALPTFRDLTLADLPSGITLPWTSITSTPTTLGGYGITNAYSRVEIDAMTFNWSRITSTPTTLAGYGITDGVRSVDGSGGTTGLTLSGGPITGTGTLTLGGTLAIANGGTGQTTANAALNALLPSQSGANGYVLATDGTNTLWTAQSGGSSSGPSAARLATTTTLPSYTASGAGLGKTLTGVAATALTIDGITPVVGDRILVKDETSTAATNNGVYTVTRQGTGASGVVEVFTITVPASPNPVGTALDGTDIQFSSPSTDYYIWFKSTSGTGVDPVPSGRTRIGASQMGYTQFDTPGQVAAAIKNFINANASANFTATQTGTVVTVTNVTAGPALHAPANDTRSGKNPNFTYNVTTPGSATVSYILTRASDFVSSIKSGTLVPVVAGNVNTDTLWMLTTDSTIVIDTTQLSFAKTNANSSGVTSFNTRTGAITLTSSDVTTALTFTPYNSTNPSGYITSAGTATNVSGIVALANGGTGLSGPGAANRVLGMNNAAGALEYKTIAAGTGVTVTHGANTITIAASGLTSATAGTGISVTGTGAITIANTGVTSLVAGTDMSISASTGAITINSTAIPSQATNSGKYLTTNGTSTSWANAPSILPVRVATTANLAWTATGSGATKTLTSGVAGVTASIDGVTIAVGDRVLVKDQTTGANNGVYSVIQDGTIALTAQVITITVTSSTVPAGSAILWSDPIDDHYFWFKTNGTGSDPAPSGRTGPTFFNVVSANSTTQIATDFATFVNSNSNGFWTATSSTNVVTLTATTASRGQAHIPASNGTPSTGWTITTTSPGTGTPVILTRAGDYNTNPVAGQLISVVAGTTNQRTTWRLTTQNAVLDTTALVYQTGATTGGTVTSVDASGGTTGLSFSGGPITGSGTLTLSGTLNVANGGTGAATLTGYVKGAGTSALTASSTIPGSDVSGNISGNAANVTGTVAVANGGTGAVTLTGYVKGAGSSALTASSTIPTSDLSGTIDGGSY